MWGHFRLLTERGTGGAVVPVRLWLWVPFFVALPGVAGQQASTVELMADGKVLQPAAVYSCASVTKELRCISAVADDTAHLSENPDARIYSIRGEIRVKGTKKTLAGGIRFYVADEKTLVDEPKYVEVALLKDGRLVVAPGGEREVLIAVYRERAGSAMAKVVWLLGSVGGLAK